MIVNLNATTCNANNVSETNIIIKRHTCKKFLLALVHSTVVDTILMLLQQSWSWYQLMQGLGGFDPISSSRSTLALHLTFRLELPMNIDELALEIAYLIHLLVY